jgi:hypothetical protein
MSTKLLIPICAAVALLAACGPRDEKPPEAADGTAVTPGTTDATDGTSTAPPPDPTATAPGAAPGEPATTQPDATSPPADPPPPGG